MRRTLSTVAAAFAALLLLAAPARADVVTASGGAGAGGHKVAWTLEFDDVADTVTIDAVHTRFSGDPQAGPPQTARINIVLPNGDRVACNLLTARLESTDRPAWNNVLFDGSAATMLNSGPRTRTNVRLRVSANRARLIEFSTDYQPPAT